MIRKSIAHVSMSALLVLAAVVPGFAAADSGQSGPGQSGPGQALAGGWNVGSATDPNVKAAADFAARQLPGQVGVTTIESVSQQVVAGMNYRLGLLLADGSRWEVVVYRRYDSAMQLTQSLKVSPVIEDKLNLNGEGLVLTAPGGAPIVVKFGTPREQVMAALASRPEAGESTNSECGAGPIDFASWPDGLNLLFQGGNFQGWSLDERADTLTLKNGVGIGTTLAQLRKHGKVTFEASTLGHEFTLDGVRGLVSSRRPAGKVTTLWAGVDCVFR